MGNGDGGERATERCPLCGVALSRGRLKKHLWKAHAGDGLSRRPGLSPPEEIGADESGKALLRCSLCGEVLREGRYAAHVKARHPPQTFAPNSRAGPARGPRYPEFSGLDDRALERRVREISRELKALSPGLSAGPEKGPARDLEKERRRITAELKGRKGTRLGATPGRWYKGPGKVRFWRPEDGG